MGLKIFVNNDMVAQNAVCYALSAMLWFIVVKCFF